MKPDTTPMRTLRMIPSGLAWCRARQMGFTLIELLVTISIVAILAALAVPSFNEIALSSKLTSFANSFMASAQLARSEAIKRNAPVTLCASSNGSSCTGAWKNGWVVLAGGTVINSQSALPNGFLLSESSGVTSIVFQSTGVGATYSTLTFCRATPTVGDQQRIIRINATGRPELTKITGATTCP